MRKNVVRLSLKSGKLVAGEVLDKIEQMNYNATCNLLVAGRALPKAKELSKDWNSILQEGAFSVDHSKQKITTFLMFDGKAEEAMNYYVSVFDQAEILSIQRYRANEAGTEGTVLQATFSLYGQVFMCIDSSVKHAFTFTPAISLYVTCATEEEVDRLFEKLSQGGEVFMPLAAYPFSDRFGWVADKYGVSWQVKTRSFRGMRRVVASITR